MYTFHPKQLFITFVSLTITVSCFSQDNSRYVYGKVNPADFMTESAAVDSNANAVAVFDKAFISFEGNQSGWFSYIFKRTKRMLIMNKNGFKHATEEIALYGNDESKEKIDKIEGSTYNLVGGSVLQTKLNSLDIFEEKADKNHVVKKFTMPALQAGSIIEFSYTIKSDFTFNLPAWAFQSDAYPVLWSECNVTIPNLLTYITFQQGYHPFAIDKGSEAFENYNIVSSRETNSLVGDQKDQLRVSTPVVVHRWVKKDLPALAGEAFVTAASNNIDKISFQLYKTYDGQNFHDVANGWGKVSEEFMKREDFGQPLTADNFWLDDILKQIVDREDPGIVKAKKIYDYLQKNYACTSRYNKFIKTSLRDVVKKKMGTVGDINLLMIAMLNHEGIAAAPVLLSTREFGRNVETFPQMERLNYVVAKIRNNNANILLDATVPFLPFGKLPLNCYNGHARTIWKDTTVIYLQPDSITEKKYSIVTISGDAQQIKGHFTKKMGFFESLNIRQTIEKVTLDKFINEYTAAYPPELEVNHVVIDSLNALESTLEAQFDFSLSQFTDADIVYFNPIISEGIRKNPFYAAERIYPIELPYLEDDIYVLNMAIPAGYIIDELPKSARIKLNDDEGMFEYIINADKETVQLKCRLQLKKTVFVSEDYPSLRDFYAFVVKKQAEQIVFKKVK